MVWEQRLDNLAALGVDTLYLQWSQHDSSAFGEQGGWLWRLSKQASDQGFSLVVGLHAESAYFEHVNQNFDADYWSVFIARNQAWGESVKAMLAQQPGLRVSGFYFPGELNDRVLADQAVVAQVGEDLRKLQQQLGRPLYVSTFYTGYASAAEYKHSLQQLQQGGIYVLHQDGAGTRAMNKNQVDEVLLTLNCQFSVIEELFVQRSDGDFERISDDLIQARFVQPGCYPRVFFSWRYITPW